MTTFDRRSFFKRGALLSGAAALPDWLARAFGVSSDRATQDPSTTAPAEDPLGVWRRQQLRAALTTAAAHGKPLLVLLVPERDQQGAAGRWYGSWMNHGGDQALEQLGSCTLAAATPAELAAECAFDAALVAAPKHAVAMMLFDAAQVLGERKEPLRMTRIEPELPAASRTAEAAEQRRTALAGGEALTAALLDGLARHGANLATLATAASARLDAASQQTLQAFIERGASAPDALLVRGTAIVRRALADLPDAERKVRRERLGAAIRAEVVLRQIAGSRWMRGGGCLSEFEHPTKQEGELYGGVACGMGMVPPLAERFLTFYAVGG
jgi:hypothetical protein